jgi:hypothetical protein
LRRRRRISFFFGQTVLSFFSSASVRQIREKFLKNETKEEEKKNGHLHKKALRVSSKSALCTREKKRSIKRKTNVKKNEIVSRAFFSRRVAFSFSLSLFCFCERCTTHIHFPG